MPFRPMHQDTDDTASAPGLHVLPVGCRIPIYCMCVTYGQFFVSVHDEDSSEELKMSASRTELLCRCVGLALPSHLTSHAIRFFFLFLFFACMHFTE